MCRATGVCMKRCPPVEWNGSDSGHCSILQGRVVRVKETDLVIDGCAPVRTHSLSFCGESRALRNERSVKSSKKFSIRIVFIGP